MARILLTSSQVSVLISATIVVFFTLALFLSGYALQQRTLRDLRAAIRPREARTSPQAHLPDYFKAKIADPGDGPASITESDALREVKEKEKEKEQEQEILLEVKESVPEPETQQDGADVAAARKNGASKRQMALVEALNAKAAQQSWAVDNPDPLSKSRIPVTRAQRRKMIKDEIQRLAQSEKPVYYQRRLW